MANRVSSFCSCLFLCLWYGLVMGKEVIRIGIVLDLNTPVGSVGERCISMAVSDFYSAHPDYRTKISLITRDSKGDVLAAFSTALDLMKNEEVLAIIGPQHSSQAKFVMELGRKAQVPIVSFSATSPSLSPADRSTYFIRTAQNDVSQVEAITSIIQAYGWREIVLIYEDTEFGNGLVPYFMHAFQEIGTQVLNRSSIPASSNEKQIRMELNKLREMRRSIFLVHMTALTGSILFTAARNAGMMSEGYAWLVTEGMSELLDPVGAKARDSMQGILGVRPYLPSSKELKSFKSRWKNQKNLASDSTASNLFGLWAYDTVWALAMAVERQASPESHFGYVNANACNSTSCLLDLGTSVVGPRLLSTIRSSNFQGLTGDFRLQNGELVPSAFEVFNVVGSIERIIGYWTPKGGLMRDLDLSSSKTDNSNSKNILKQPLWPGDTTEQPRKLRIGVPMGQNEYIMVEWRPESNAPFISGYSLDIFKAVVDVLPFPLPFELVPYVDKDRQSNGTYNELLHEIKSQKFDAVVGDTTIQANRSTYVDFTLPYSDSGISMVVPMKRVERENMWIFLKPLSWDLWLTTAVAFTFTGLVVWVLEHRINTDFRGPPTQQLGTMLWFSFSTLVFAHREKVLSNWTKFVVTVWMFVALVLTQSYTASLASMLTVQRLQPAFDDFKEIQKNGYFVGYRYLSFVRDFLIEQLGFDESKLRNYTTPEQFDAALSGGTHNGGVAAIFDESPYMKLFLAQYCSKYKMVGQVYKTGGFGFAFPLGSPLVSHISRAILNVTEDKNKIREIEQKNFGGKISCEDQDATLSSGSLSVSSFGGLFLIAGAASLSSFLISITMFLYKHWPLATQQGNFRSRILELAKHFDQKDLSTRHFIGSKSRVHPETSLDHFSASPSSDYTENQSQETIEVMKEVRNEQH